MLKVCLPLLLAHGVVHAAAQFDPPDLGLEARMHQDYVRVSNGDSVRAPANSATPGLVESYQLQKGENLWSLSRMLYGDGSYWPRVWAQNKDITNPHLIRKGHTLQLMLGSEDEAPAFRFSENDEGSGLELTAASSASNPQIEIPDPEIQPRPILRLPRSFPQYQNAFKGKDNFGVQRIDEHLNLERARIAGRFPLSAYVQDEQISSEGRFLEPEREMALPVAMQYVYVKIRKGKGAEGKRFLIVKDYGTLPKLNSQVAGNMNARFIQVYGDVQLAEKTVPSFKTSSDAKLYDVYRALILHAVNVTQNDFDLIPGEVQIVDMSTEGPPSQAVAQVIGSAKAQTSILYGIGDIVFINKGSKDGVKAGDIMDLYIDRTIRNPNTPVRYAGNPSGKYKVAKVSDHCATGIILSAVDSIQQGDRASGPKVASISTVPDEVPLKEDNPDSKLEEGMPGEQEAQPASDGGANDLGDLPAE